MASVFTEGLVAAKRDLNADENPYEEGTDKHDWWNDGFRAAHSETYRSEQGQLLKEKPVYEKGFKEAS